MERSLLLGALALGIVSWCCGLVAARAYPVAAESAREATPRIATPFWILAIAAPLIFWLATLPEAPPFGMGHACGNGALLGGWAAVIGVFALLRCVHWHSPESRAAGLAMLLALAVVVALAPLLMWKQGKLDALMGISLGWLAALFLLSLGFAESLLLTKATAFGVTVCACLGLGVFRDALMPGSQDATWGNLMALLASALPFVLLLCALPAGLMARSIPLPSPIARRDGNNAPLGWQVLLAALLFLIVAQLLAMKVADNSSLLFCAALGAFGGIIAWRVTADSRGNGSDSSPPVLAALVLLAAFIVAYRLMQGFGGGVMMLAAWLPALAADDAVGTKDPLPNAHPLAPSPSHPFTALLGFGAAAMLYRFADTRFQLELNTLNLDEYFSFFALLLGAAIPPFLARLQERQRDNAIVEIILRALLGGAILIAVPLLGMMLWGAQTVLVLTAGAALGLLLLPVGKRVAGAGHISPIFFALGGALAVAQWTKHALPLYEITRDEKAKILGGGALGLAILLLMVDIVSRLRKQQEV